ncbi:hypothetical protein FRACYDRAFT_245577 [Fragilariopsis cylindrus CCMP1102]|uniref:Uncharacterized protein n=1 Tax=Fragilariopsis cylindrus CCMP1102 TaxID=635003 RepID=A0A1E7EZY3_9STRA|nr:hypothetical protein FRACYDRAFT_245577 [Fragilariopsis cylindrus CCMP1102]|eukprot:OEU11522.1 hypothetical protein FRACYDRAFT_245577 [Fragilariopsis cylindrus CCMP1102]
MAPSKNTSMNSSEGQLNHDGFHSARGRTVGTFITNTLEGAVGSARKSFESEDIDPLDRAEELQDHNNHRPRQKKDDQLSYKQRNRNNNEKYQKTDNSIESVLEQLSHSKSSATVDLCCSDNEDNATEDDGDNLEVESKSKSGGENESGSKHFKVLLDARITKKCDDSVNNNNNDSGRGGRSNKMNRDGLDRRENSNRSSDEESRTQHKRHLNIEEVHTTADSCSNNEKKLSHRRQEKTSDEGKKNLSDDEQKSNDEINSDSHRSNSCQQPREEKVDKKRRPQSSDEPSDERNTESNFRNSKQSSQQQKKRGKSQKNNNTSIEFKIPKLKNSSHSSKYKPRTVDSDSDNDWDHFREHLLKMVEAAESNDFVLQRTTTQRRNRDSATIDMDMDTSLASTSDNMSQNSSISLFNIRKVAKNGKKKKLKGGKIIPGQAIMNSRYNYSEPIQKKTRRREEDRDENHDGIKGDNIQYSGTNNWNPLNGSRYSDQQNTRSSSTRVNSTLSSSLSQESTNRTRSARPKANRDTEFSSQESPRNNRRSKRNNKTQKNDKTPETIDITNSDSDSDDDDIVMEDNQIMERLAINNKVRNQEDHQPMIKFDFESNTMLLSFIKSKVDVTKGRSEILIGMGDVQEMSYFEMNDAAVQNNIDLDLDSFIYLHAEAERPGVRSRTQNYKFELEFEEDEHLHDLIQAVGDSGILTPTQTQPEDIEIDAKALIEDSRKKYKLRSRATPQKKDPFIAHKKGRRHLTCVSIWRGQEQN